MAEPNPESTKPEAKEAQILSAVVFTKAEKKGGRVEYKSSAPGRKIIILSDSSIKPRPNMLYSVRVIEDTEPGDPSKGKLIAEIYYEEKDFQAQELATQAKELRPTAKTAEDYIELAKMYGEIEKLYLPPEVPPTA